MSYLQILRSQLKCPHLVSRFFNNFFLKSFHWNFNDFFYGVEFLLLAGVYISSLSSCLGAMYGTPRVLQSIANEKVIPVINVLGQGVNKFKIFFYFLMKKNFLIVYLFAERSEQNTRLCHDRDRHYDYHLYSSGWYQYVSSDSNDAIFVNLRSSRLRLLRPSSDLWYTTPKGATI